MRELLTYDRANALQRFLRWSAATGPGSRVFSRIQHHIDRPVFRVTGGRHTFTSLVSGLPIVMLTTRGARSGRPRTVPVVGVPIAEGFAVVASNYGRRRHPAWYHNLRSHPEGELVVDGETLPCRAVEAEGDTRDRIWHEGLRFYPGWTEYQRRMPHRQIAVFVLAVDQPSPAR